MPEPRKTIEEYIDVSNKDRVAEMFDTLKNEAHKSIDCAESFLLLSFESKEGVAITTASHVTTMVHMIANTFIENDTFSQSFLIALVFLSQKEPDIFMRICQMNGVQVKVKV